MKKYLSYDSIPVDQLRKSISALAEEITKSNRYFWDILRERNNVPWYLAGGREDVRPVTVSATAPYTDLQTRGTLKEAVFTVYNNRELLTGHLGSAVECVFIKKGKMRRRNGDYCELYAPGQGWLN